MIKKVLAGILCGMCGWAYGQFDPSVAQGGQDAVHKDHAGIRFWAQTCSVQRGWQDIADTALGKTTSGEPSFATGKADGLEVVSLGDGGSAILTFEDVITNGQGPDFAVYENSFDGLFLELAFVEVSSDGIHYVRFPAISNADTMYQLHDTVEASLIYNFAGKYIGGYGTPFDLEELKDSLYLDINAITHVRIVDATGSINPEYCSRDSEGKMVNESYPTPWPTGGFDLDGVGVIHSSKDLVGVKEPVYTKEHPMVYPNPAKQGEVVQVSGTVSLYSGQGMYMGEFQNELDTSILHSGIYFLKTNQRCTRLVLH